jgi:uroporphyrinogen-III synthase
LNKVLRGISVIVTRPAGQADALCALIEQQGGKAVRMPLLEIQGLLPENAPISAAEKFAAYDWVVFISANAVNFALQANDGTIRQLRGVRFAAVGNATAKAMREKQLPVDAMPHEGFNSEALLELPEFQDVEDQACLIVRGQGGREWLADTLRSRGARVEYWEVYKRAKPALEPARLNAWLAENRPAVLTVTSGEALQNFIDLYNAAIPEAWLATPLVAVSGRIGRIAQQAGFIRVAVALESSDAAIIKTVSALIDGE